MRVAVIGSRGMPGVNGGIERHVEELYPRLVERGVSVTVYARSAYCQGDTECGGVRVVSLGCLSGRYTEAITHTARSLWHARRGGYDLVHVHAIGPGLLLPCARLLGFRRSVLTFHALDYERAKWGPVAKAVLRISEQVAVRCASEVIAVSTSGARHLEGKYRRRIHYIPNGPGKLTKRPPGQLLQRLGLRGGDYVLFVGRLIPEKCPDDLVAAMRELPELKVVFAGDSSYTNEYTNRLRSAAGAQAMFPGYMYGSDLEELYSSALAYVLPSEVEGLSISLLEAMAFGLPVVVSDIPGNVEALGDPAAGLVYPLRDRGALAAALESLAGSSELRRDLGAKAVARVEQVYDWEAIADQTLAVYERALGRLWSN
ncbi:MAG: glycosyltransferase family 4 protein [Candidatus Eisenbacteria bacterium]|nr:glycosyltransferase family 4 protein [Candidatus Eisenbacteria bacterium]